MKFLKLTEHNDWEGESWNFFLQVDGNEEAIKEFSEYVISKNSDFWDISSELVDETEVDILVKHSPTGYMNMFIKVTGTFDWEKLKQEMYTSDVDDEWWHPMGKGEIQYYFK